MRRIAFPLFMGVILTSCVSQKELQTAQQSLRTELQKTFQAEIETNRQRTQTALAELAFPVGSIVPFGGNTLPDGWLWCDGRELPIINYRTLFQAIGNNWGGANSTFKLPDLRGRFLRGVDSSGTIDIGIRTDIMGRPVTERRSGTYQSEATKAPTVPFRGTAAEAGAHHHRFRDQGTSYESREGSGRAGTRHGDQVNKSTYDAGEHTHAISISGGGDNETRPKNAAVMYMVKYK